MTVISVDGHNKYRGEIIVEFKRRLELSNA